MPEELKLFTERIENFYSLKAAEKIDFLAYFFSVENKKGVFATSDILEGYKKLKIAAYSNVPQYIKSNSDLARPKKKKVKFIRSGTGYHLENQFEKELATRIQSNEKPFMDFSVSQSSLPWKPSDIPFLNSKTRRNADFFSKLYYLLYHLENSLRKFLHNRLIAILGESWESQLFTTIDLNKAQSIRKEASLSEMLPDRGDNILFYCMWDDYGKIIKQFPTVFSRPKEADEIIAHLNSMAKIRNAIAHNTATIPKDFQEEMTVFLKKYIKIMGRENI